MMSRKRTGTIFGLRLAAPTSMPWLGDRIELVEIHHVLAGLAVDPVDRRLDRQLPQMVAEFVRDTA